MLTWLRNWWWATQRAMDVRFLWPACKRATRCMEEARFVFMAHALLTPSWASHYGDGLEDAVERLP